MSYSPPLESVVAYATTNGRLDEDAVVSTSSSAATTTSSPNSSGSEGVKHHCVSCGRLFTFIGLRDDPRRSPSNDLDEGDEEPCATRGLCEQCKKGWRTRMFTSMNESALSPMDSIDEDPIGLVYAGWTR